MGRIVRLARHPATGAKTGTGLLLTHGMLFMNRLQFGFYSDLARLDVEVDYAAEERAFLS